MHLFPLLHVGSQVPHLTHKTGSVGTLCFVRKEPGTSSTPQPFEGGWRERPSLEAPFFLPRKRAFRGAKRLYWVPWAGFSGQDLCSSTQQWLLSHRPSRGRSTDPGVKADPVPPQPPAAVLSRLAHVSPTSQFPVSSVSELEGALRGVAHSQPWSDFKLQFLVTVLPCEPFSIHF